MSSVGCSAVCSFLQISVAYAEMTAKELVDTLANPYVRVREFVMSFFVGTQNGRSWANTQLAYDKMPLVYCVPPKMGLTGEQVLDVLKRHLEEVPTDKNFPVGLALLRAMRSTFPCT
ncbi:MAG: Rap1a/Tai family immunity protein [Pseudobdellovibrionaceae bacterium]